MSAVRQTMTVLAPAKVNLILQVLGKRSNGYHDIRSVVVPVSIFDRINLETLGGSEIRFALSPSSSIQPEELKLARDGDNLAVRAVKAFRELTGIGHGLGIMLEKHIPVGGGLGGGSADAAAVLNGLNMLWDARVDAQLLGQAGSKLGCDVPALLAGGVVCMEGLGERVTPIKADGNTPREGWWLVIAYPGFSVSTRDIYSRHSLSLTVDDEKYKSMVCSLRAADLLLAAENLHNDLQDTVFRKYPLIEIMVERLCEAGAMGAMVSGSGASILGLARDQQHAARVAGEFQERLGMPVWVRVAKTLPDGVMAAHGPLEA